MNDTATDKQVIIDPILEAAIDRASAPALVDQDPVTFQAALAGAELNWETLLDWIRAHLVIDTDYGIIKKGQKPSLYKPGAEKICGRLGWVADFPDLEKYVDVVVSGKRIDTVLLRCHIQNSAGLRLGMGAGSFECSQTQGVYEYDQQQGRRIKVSDEEVYDLNKAVKMAEKRAFVDAVLRSVGISAIFSQDAPKEGQDNRPVGESIVELEYLEKKAQELAGDKWEQWLEALAKRKFQIKDGDYKLIPIFRVQHAVAALEQGAKSKKVEI